MRRSRIIRVRRPKRLSAVWLRTVAGRQVRASRQPRRTRPRAIYPPEIDHVRHRLELRALWDQVPGLRLCLHGQLPSGKNQVGMKHEPSVVPLLAEPVHRHPNARFARWRRDAAKQVLAQIGSWRASLPVSVPILMYVWYWPGDRRTRDRSGMTDALFHLLEHAGIIANDGLIEDLLWRTMPLDKEDPRVVLVLRPYFPLQSPTLSYTPELERSACALCWMPFDQHALRIPA